MINFGMNLTSDASSTIFGHAIDNEVLAISSADRLRDYTNNYAFFDTSTEQFYEINEVLDSDEYVSIYSITNIDATRVIREAVIRSKPKKLSFIMNWANGRCE